MVIDPDVPAVILGISDINPIQFWAPDRAPFNQQRIKLITPKKYFQQFDFNEQLYTRLDILLNEVRLDDWDAAVTYNTGDKVYDPFTGTRWISTIDDNTNNDPNPPNDVTHPSAAWDHDSLIVPTFGIPTDYDPIAVYNLGDRVLYYSGLGTSQHVAISLIDANVGNQPHGNIGTKWDVVTESRGTNVKLKMVVPGKPATYRADYNYQINAEVTYGYDTYISLAGGNIGNVPSISPLSWMLTGTNSREFKRIRLGSNHESVNFLWSEYPDVEDKTISLVIYDVALETVLAVSDCIKILVNDFRPSVTIKYSNSDDFNGINFEGVNAEFYIRLNACFYVETHPVVVEDREFTTGVIVSLRKQMVTKRLLDIIELLPEIMHRKIEQILMCDFLEVAGLPCKRQDEYQRAPAETSLLSTAKVLLTQQDSVLVNISKGDIYSGGSVFSNEFSRIFA